LAHLHHREIIAIAAVDAIDINSAFKQRDSCGHLCSNESFLAVDDISITCCDLCSHLL